MATSSKQAFHKNLECPVCLRFFRDPKILTCSHTFCKGCLETLLGSRRKLSCPMCREETSVPGGDVGRLQSNIAVRSLVEDVETQGQSNCNQEDKPLQRKWNKCQKHPNYDEECFCLDCNKYVCFKCGTLEHTMNAHSIMEAGELETAQKNNIDELASKADTKIRDVDKYVTFVVGQRKRVHDVHEQRKKEIDETFEESVQTLKKRKTVLENEVGHELGKLETSLGDMEESGRKQKDQIKRALDSVRNGLQFPLQVEALTSHRATCQQLEELLSPIGPDEELPRRTAEEGERVCFRGQGSDGLQLGKLIRQKKSKWVLRTEDPLPAVSTVKGMAISPNNEMAVATLTEGIFIYSSEGIMKGTLLKNVSCVALDCMPHTGYVIRDFSNRISLYTDRSEKLDVTFETMDKVNGTSGGLTVGKDGLIFIAYNSCNKIQVFKPEGGKAIREITYNGYALWQMFAMTSSQAILVKNFCYEIQVINDVTGAIIHSIREPDGKRAYPAVCQDSSIIVAWIKEDQGLLSIVQYTHELKYIKNILTDFKINVTFPWYCHLRAFKTGEIAFCTDDRLYIFHETLD